MITDKLTNGHQDNTTNILPSIEIIDLMLSTIFSILQGLKKCEGGVIIRNADDITGFTYKPMLVGDNASV